MHITVAIFDDLPFMPPRFVDVVKDAMPSLNGPALQIGFDRLVSNERTTCLIPNEGLPALKAFQKQLKAALARADLPLRKNWSFSPHVTLLYDLAVPRNEAILPIGWKAEEIVMIHSLVGLTQHIVLERWPLVEQHLLL